MQITKIESEYQNLISKEKKFRCLMINKYFSAFIFKYSETTFLFYIDSVIVNWIAIIVDTFRQCK